MMNKRISDDLKELLGVIEKHDQLVEFFDLSLDLLALANLDGYFVMLNNSWESVLGWSEEELTSKPYVEFVHPDDVQSTLDAAKQLEEGKDVIDFTNRYKKKDGTYVTLVWRSKVNVDKGIIFANARVKNDEDDPRAT